MKRVPMMKKLFIPLLMALLFVTLGKTTPVYAGETAEYATPVNPGSKESEEITEENLDQYFKITTKSAGWVTFDLVSNLNRTYIQIFDQTGNVLTSGYYDYNETIQKLNYSYTAALEAGTYYVKTSGYRQYYSTYYGTVTFAPSFKAANNNEVEPNNDASQAQALTLNDKKSVRGFISWNDTDDYYKVSFKKAGYFYLNITSYMPRLRVRVVEDNGTVVFDEYHDWDSTMQKRVIKIGQYLEAGTYTIYLTGYRQYYYDSYGAYEIAAGIDYANKTVVEPNNTIEDAYKIKFSKNTSSKMNGLLSLQDGEDYYATNIDSNNSTLVLNLGISAPKFYVKIYNSNGEQVYSGDFYANEGKKVTNNKIVLDNLAKGTYYICITNYKQYYTTYYGTYTLQLNTGKTKPVKVKVNALKENATKVSGTAEKYATVTVKVGSKSYKAVADSKGKFNVAVPKLKKNTSVKVAYTNVAGIKSGTTTIKVK